MDWLSWVFLGFLQGLTEFLPVSSSGHLVLAQHFLGVGSPGVLLEVTVHVGTAGAIAVVFGRDLLRMGSAVARRLASRAGGTPEDASWRRLAANLVLATAVTGVIGLSLERFIRGAFDSPALAAFMLLVTGVVLLISAHLSSGRRGLREAGAADAVWVGLAQGLAIFPGLSRSGLTIVSALSRGFSGMDAARFSFLLSLPAIAAAALIETARLRELGPAVWTSTPTVGLALAFAAAFASGLLAITVLVRLVSLGRLHRFAWYCFAVGGAALALLVR